MTNIKKALILMTLMSLTACSQESGPKAEQEFMAIIKEMQASYSDAEKIHNDILADKAVRTGKERLFDASHNVEGWTAEVVEISDVFGVMIEAKNKDVTFKMIMVNPDSKKLANNLKRGDEILFSGELGHESSFTDYGTVTNPEFAFTPKFIYKKGDVDKIAQ